MLVSSVLSRIPKAALVQCRTNLVSAISKQNPRSFSIFNRDFRSVHGHSNTTTALAAQCRTSLVSGASKQNHPTTFSTLNNTSRFRSYHGSSFDQVAPLQRASLLTHSTLASAFQSRAFSSSSAQGSKVHSICASSAVTDKTEALELMAKELEELKYTVADMKKEMSSTKESLSKLEKSGGTAYSDSDTKLNFEQKMELRTRKLAAVHRLLGVDSNWELIFFSLFLSICIGFVSFGILCLVFESR